VVNLRDVEALACDCEDVAHARAVLDSPGVFHVFLWPSDGVLEGYTRRMVEREVRLLGCELQGEWLLILGSHEAGFLCPHGSLPAHAACIPGGGLPAVVRSPLRGRAMAGHGSPGGQGPAGQCEGEPARDEPIASWRGGSGSGARYHPWRSASLVRRTRRGSPTRGRGLRGCATGVRPRPAQRPGLLRVGFLGSLRGHPRSAFPQSLPECQEHRVVGHGTAAPETTKPAEERAFVVCRGTGFFL
jgi:hypothetical protein